MANLRNINVKKNFCASIELKRKTAILSEYPPPNVNEEVISKEKIK